MDGVLPNPNEPSDRPGEFGFSERPGEFEFYQTLSAPEWSREFEQWQGDLTGVCDRFVDFGFHAAFVEWE
ncbi:MAG: hypothetical protein QOE07_2302 [Acidimicrobiaceae bacterium]|nr:hypothetical protein [Acidimicrobiaceae bacterium]